MREVRITRWLSSLWLSCALFAQASCASTAPYEEADAGEIEGQVLALSSAPACNVSELSFTTGTGLADTQTCAGPFQYFEDTTVKGPCADNGKCIENKTCRHWDHGAEPAATAYKSMFYQQNGACAQCEMWSDGGRTPMCYEWTDCEPYLADVTEDRATCKSEGDKLAAATKAAVVATWNGDKVRNERLTTDLGEITLRGADSRRGTAIFDAECSISFRYDIPISEASSSCGCAKVKDDKCDLKGPRVTRVSAPNLTRDMLPTNAIEPVCSTCQHLPLRGPTDAQAMFDCLTGMVNEGATQAIQDEARRRAALVFERYGEGLNTQSYARGLQWLGARAGSLSCGVAPLASDYACLPEASRASTKSTLATCQRLTAPHASTEVAQQELASCFAAIELFERDGASCDEQTRKEVRTLLDGLVARSLTSLAWTKEDLSQIRGALSRIDLWYRLARMQEANETSRTFERLSPLLASFWTAVYEQTVRDLGVASKSGHQEALIGALAEAVGARTDAQLAVLTAAFTAPAPLPSPPLLIVIGDALSPLLEGLGQRGRLHDVACRFTSCGPLEPSEVSALYALLASVLTEEELSAALSNGRRVLPQAVFEAFDLMKREHKTLRAAYAALVGRPSRLTELRTTPVVMGAETLQSIAQRARAASSNFAKSGFFHVQQNTLHFGIDKRVRDQLLARMREALNSLQAEKTAFSDAKTRIVQDLLTQLDARKYAVEAEHRAQQLYRRTEEVVADMSGLRTRDAAETLRFADSARAVHEVFTGPQVADALAFSSANESLNVSGKSARLRDRIWSNVSAIAALKDGKSFSMPFEAKDRLRVEVSGQWSPTCAIRNAMVKSSVMPFGDNASDAKTGPEGFWLESVGSKGRVRSIYANEERYTRKEKSTRTCVGLSGSVGVQIPDISPYKASLDATVSTESCESTARGTSSSKGASSSTSTEQHMSARFNMGLRVEGTPFLDAPAGALLLVVLPRGSVEIGDITDVVVAVPGSILMIEKPSDVYLVVNDSADCAGLDSEALYVDLQRIRPVGAHAVAFANAQTTVTAELRSQRDRLLAQGSLGAVELSSLRARAVSTLARELGADVSRLPPEVTSYFSDFVDTELASLERHGRLLSLMRELDHLRNETLALRKEMITGSQKLRLGDLLLHWHVTDLAAPELEDVTQEYLRLVTELAYPVLQLRHPSALSALATNEAIAALRNTKLTTPFDTQVEKLVTFGRALDRELSSRLEPEESATLVSLAIPRASATPDLLDYRRAVDPLRAQTFWDHVDRGEVAPLEIGVKDLYEDIKRGPASDILRCKQTAPVIDSVGLFGLAPRESDAFGWNSSEWSMGADFAPYLLFPDESGATSYEVGNPINDKEREPVRNWLTASIGMTFGSVPADMTEEKVRKKWVGLGEGGGLSPFAHYRIDLRNLPAERAKSLEVVFLTFLLNSRKSSVGLTPWLDTCPDYRQPEHVDAPLPEAPALPEAPITAEAGASVACTQTCTPGSRRCGANHIEHCVTASDGCARFTPTEICSGTLTCDSKTVSCMAPPITRELICSNARDDDGDGAVDCLDEDCALNRKCAALLAPSFPPVFPPSLPPDTPLPILPFPPRGGDPLCRPPYHCAEPGTLFP